MEPLSEAATLPNLRSPECLARGLPQGGKPARRSVLRRTVCRSRRRKGKRISFLLEDDVYRPLAHHCIDADMTIQRFVVEAIREKLARAHSGQ